MQNNEVVSGEGSLAGLSAVKFPEELADSYNLVIYEDYDNNRSQYREALTRSIMTWSMEPATEPATESATEPATESYSHYVLR